LAKALADAGWRPEDLARRLNAAAEAHHYAVKLNPKTPFKWRDQGVQPRPPWPELIALVLSEATSAAFLPEDFGWRSHAGVAPACGLAQTPWTVEGAQHAMRDLTHAPLQRRRFLMLAGAAATAAPLKWLVTPEVERVIGRGDGQISDTVITEIDQTTASARRMNDQLGSTVELLDLVHAQFAFVSRLLDRYSYTDSVGRRLHASAGELLRLGGWIAFDRGDHGRAQHYWTTALRAAHTAGDRALGANIIGFMSCATKNLPGGGQQAVTLAETALAGYPGASPRVSAILAFRLAEAHAVAGSTSGCRRMIDTAFDQLDAVQPADAPEPAWAYWMGQRQAHGQAGYCYLRLHDWSRARHHLRAATSTSSIGYSRAAVHRQLLLARTYLHQPVPEVEHAVTLAERAAAELDGNVRSERCVDHLGQLVTALGPYQRRGAPVTDLIRHARHLIATTNATAN